MYSDLFTFPFKQVGIGLRTLSLSSPGGNVAACVLYVALCALPLVYLTWRIRFRKKPFRGEDVLLVLLSVLLAVTLYVMINPGKMNKWIALSDGSAYCFTVWSMIAGWLVLKIIFKIPAITEQNLARHIRGLLIVLGGLLSASVFLGIFLDLLPEIQTVKMSGDYSAGVYGTSEIYTTSGDGVYGMDWSQGDIIGNSVVYLWLKYIVDQIPILLDVLIVFSGAKLAGNLEINRYSEDTLHCAQKLGKMCIGVTVVMALKPIFLNLLQLFMGGMILDADFRVEFPVFSIILVMVVFLLAKYFSGAKELKEDSDLII